MAVCIAAKVRLTYSGLYRPVVSRGQPKFEFRYHHMNTQGPTNEQAGTEPLVTRAIGFEAKQKGKTQNVE
jgi:hypothetical protein